MEKHKKRIIIIGAGFGGVYTARKLAKKLKQTEVEIILIGRVNYFLFTPLLPEVATGSLSPLSVAEPIREIFRHLSVRFIQSEVKSINLAKKQIKLKTAVLSYDILIVSSGAKTNWHNVIGADKYTLPLKSLADAAAIRNRIIDAFEQAANEPSQKVRRELLSFVVVGGGATGVELVAELSEFIHGTMCQYYAGTFCLAKEVRISLISGQQALLSQFEAVFQRQARQILKQKNINIFEGRKVVSISKEAISLDDGKTIASQTVIWVAGVSPQYPTIYPSGKFDVAKGLPVDKFLRLIDWPEVFILGDVAVASTNGKIVPMMAQVAVQQSEIIALNVINFINDNRLITFSYRPKGSLLSLGQWQAIGRIYGIPIGGQLAWWLWRTVYLFKFISPKKKFKVAFEWTINLFYPRDITKI